ncbi:MAG TPA: CBS domain-containing protein [Acidimicrobiales bacterium]|nr:CBS domain-containing protein [Acidimicrobiales bacterium]
MKVEAILKVKGRHVETIEPAERMSTAVHKLATLGIGALVVTREGSHVEGILAEREVVRGLSRHGAAMLDMHVSALMNRAVPVCSPEDSVKYVMAEMTRTRNRHLPVVVGGRLAGLVSLGDVVKNRVEEMEMEVAIRRDTYIARR